jgi:hypothetical protein
MAALEPQRLGGVRDVETLALQFRLDRRSFETLHSFGQGSGTESGGGNAGAGAERGQRGAQDFRADLAVTGGDEQQALDATANCRGFQPFCSAICRVKCSTSTGMSSMRSRNDGRRSGKT